MAEAYLCPNLILKEEVLTETPYIELFMPHLSVVYNSGAGVSAGSSLIDREEALLAGEFGKEC